MDSVTRYGGYETQPLLERRGRTKAFQDENHRKGEKRGESWVTRRPVHHHQPAWGGSRGCPVIVEVERGNLIHQKGGGEETIKASTI